MCAGGRAGSGGAVLCLAAVLTQGKRPSVAMTALRTLLPLDGPASTDAIGPNRTFEQPAANGSCKPNLPKFWNAAKVRFQKIGTEHSEFGIFCAMKKEENRFMMFG
jgi:hypothetical protein